MPNAYEIAQFLDEYLNVSKFAGDSSNNGLQFDAGNEVSKVVFGVDASRALFAAAADADADLVVVHHGISWGGSLKRINSMDAERVAMLAGNQISLYAAHLPLDAHPDAGHNAILAAMLELEKRTPFAKYHNYDIGFYGDLSRKKTVLEVAEFFEDKLPSDSDFTIVGNSKKKVKRIGVVSGGGAFPDLFPEMKNLGIDCLVTGEFTHEAWHPSMETDIPVVALGHYRSETPGVIALREIVEERFGIPCAYIDLPTGF